MSNSSINSIQPKRIHFFLHDFDNKTRISNLEELRSKKEINLEHLFELYSEGILEHWLSVQNCDEILEQLSAVPKDKKDENTIRQFASILFPEEKSIDIEFMVKEWLSITNEKQQLSIFEKNQNDWNSYITNYHNGFYELLNSLRVDAQNMPALKAHIQKLRDNYLQLLSINPWQIISSLFHTSPASILLMMADNVLRDFLKKVSYYDEVSRFIRDKLRHSNSYSSIQSELVSLSKKNPSFFLPELENFSFKQSEYELQLTLPDFVFPVEDKNIITYVKTTNKNTDNAWDDIEVSGKLFMILDAPVKSVRPYKQQNGELSSEQLKDFPIIDGIEFRNSSANNILIYMEV